MNGRQRAVKVTDKKAMVQTKVRPKADKSNKGSVGAPMPGKGSSSGIGSSSSSSSSWKYKERKVR